MNGNKPESKVLVTGASRGIGKSLARMLLKESFEVIGTAHNTSFDHELSNNTSFNGINVNLNSLSETRDKIQPLFEQSEGPAVIVNNAGISEASPFSSSDKEWLDNWNRSMQINLKTPALICKWALNHWTNNDIPGIIINISSRAGFRGDTSEFAAYAASKGGLAAFTKSIARDYGEHNITAYTIAPGFVDTDMAQQVKQVYGESYLKKDRALDELTPPGEIAQIVLFLTKGNGRHMTGTTFHVNAGSYMV